VGRLRALLEVVLALVFWIVLTMVLIAVAYPIAGVKHVKEMSPLPRMVVTLAGIALLSPAVLLAARATKRRIGTLSSVKGHLRWRWLGTCLSAALAVRALPVALGVLGVVTGDHFAGWGAFLPQLGLVLVLVPIQAAGEEYFYRGAVMQAVGAFTWSAWEPAILSTAAFTVSHGFRPETVIAIGAIGASSAWMTLRTGGLEASLGYHIVLNVSVMGLSTATTGLEPGHNDHVHWLGVALSIASVAIYTAVIAQLAKSLPPGSDQVEEDPPERSVSVEHADHGGDAHALAPEQQQPGG